jgi:hypothetical protein
MALVVGVTEHLLCVHLPFISLLSVTSVQTFCHCPVGFFPCRIQQNNYLESVGTQPAGATINSQVPGP